MLKKNLIANYLGQGWSAIMGIAFIPVFISYLGVEAYGLIGLYAVLQAWLSLLDMGMTPTLSREMARFTGGQHSAQSIRDLLRSVECIALAVAAIMAGMIALGSDWLAVNWLQADNLPAHTVGQAIAIMGAVAAFRFLEGIYRSALVGLQRQVLFNVLNAILSTVRWVGAIAVLATVSNTIQAFFIWQALISLLTVGIFAAATYLILPCSGAPGKFSIVEIKKIARYAGGMLGITFLALLLTQVDKVLLSKLLNLDEFGLYALAAAVAGGLNMLVSPITQAFFPRLSELHARGDFAGLCAAFHLGAQIVTVVMGTAAVVLAVFAYPILLIWTQDPLLAERTAPLMRLLVIGNLLNGLMWIPYQTQLAHGWTSLTVKINIVAVALIVPAIIIVTPLYGAEGAAWVWISLNIGYLIIGVNLMFRYIMKDEKWRWYVSDVLWPLSAASAASVLCLLLIGSGTGPWHASAGLFLGAATSFGAATFCADRIRSFAFHFIWRKNILNKTQIERSE